MSSILPLRILFTNLLFRDSRCRNAPFCTTHKTQWPKKPFTSHPTNVISYLDMTKAVTNKKKVIIDVRNQDEIKSTGQIPGSINIPLKDLQHVLTSMSEEEFMRNYQRKKPSISDELIFYCRTGRRAEQATIKAIKIGYSNAKNYSGSWREWSSKNK